MKVEIPYIRLRELDEVIGRFLNDEKEEGLWDNYTHPSNPDSILIATRISTKLEQLGFTCVLRIKMGRHQNWFEARVSKEETHPTIPTNTTTHSLITTSVNSVASWGGVLEQLHREGWIK